MSKKQNQSQYLKKAAEAGKKAPPKKNSADSPGEFQPHNAQKEGLGPNTDRSR